ncbi:MAG TPA: hypothetical protein VLA46_13860, partial [Saprospiraceae bacterium]|nr:hypothetical protein [Saprospiraceae bacterium]
MKTSSGAETTKVMSFERVITFQAVSWVQIPVVERSRNEQCTIAVSGCRIPTENKPFTPPLASQGYSIESNF